MNLIKKSKWRMIAGNNYRYTDRIGSGWYCICQPAEFRTSAQRRTAGKNQTFAPVQGWGIPKSASHGSSDFGRWALTGHVEVPVFKTGKTLSR